jgi:hypothetical protein
VNFNSILIGSEDPQRLTDYYTKLFGKPAMEDQGYAGWQLGTGWVTVGPHDQVHGKSAQPGRLLWNIESQDVKGDFDRLKAAGAIVRARWGRPRSSASRAQSAVRHLTVSPPI